MLATARAFLEHLIDYAGMFPPARLPMSDAYRQYVGLAAASESWMLGRFVCPAAKLGDLLALAQTDDALTTLGVAALGRGGASSRDDGWRAPQGPAGYAVRSDRGRGGGLINASDR